MSEFSKHMGLTFTPTIHSKPAGHTDPLSNSLPPKFVVVVTGAGKGLGRHIALTYAKAGAHGVSISSRTKEDIDSLAAELHAINPSLIVHTQICDTTKDADVRELAQSVDARFGRVDAVIANAGIISKYIYDPDGSNRRLPVGIIEDDDFERVISINLLGTRLTGKYFLPLLAKTKDGAQAFVVITSAASHFEHSQATTMAYNLSKIALNRMAESVHNDHGKDGILAFAVHPGTVLTPQTQLHSTQKGDLWDQGMSLKQSILHVADIHTVLTDDPALCGGFLTWLTKERREWLSGRYVSVNWDVDELVSMKDDIVSMDKLKMRMVV